MYRRWYRRWGSALLIACLTAPGLVVAQDRRDLPKLGVLWVFDPSTAAPYVRAFKEALRERGWIDGRTVQIIERYDNNDPARRQLIAEEIVALQVDLLHVNDAILPAARKASQTIPMVCPDFYDPIEEGFTTSLARPDRNVTGMSWQTIESAIKRLQLTRELVPRARRIGWLFDTTDPGAAIELRGIVAAGRAAGVTVEKFEFRTSADAEFQLARLKGAQLDALIVPYSVWSVIDRIVDVATANRLPVVSEPVEFARAGAVMTYGPDTLHMIRRSAYLVDAILKGASPCGLTHRATNPVSPHGQSQGRAGSRNYHPGLHHAASNRGNPVMPGDVTRNTYEASTCQEPKEVRRKIEGLPLLGFTLSRPRLV